LVPNPTHAPLSLRPARFLSPAGPVFLSFPPRARPSPARAQASASASPRPLSLTRSPARARAGLLPWLPARPTPPVSARATRSPPLTSQPHTSATTRPRLCFARVPRESPPARPHPPAAPSPPFLPPRRETEPRDHRRGRRDPYPAAPRRDLRPASLNAQAGPPPSTPIRRANPSRRLVTARSGAPPRPPPVSPCAASIQHPRRCSGPSNPRFASAADSAPGTRDQDAGSRTPSTSSRTQRRPRRRSTPSSPLRRLSLQSGAR